MTETVPPFSPPSRVLITGAAGFLGAALLGEFARAGVAVRAFDVAPLAEPPPGDIQAVVGDVADAASVARAVEGCDAMVIAHMAPNRPEVYASATAPFDINVKGCALLLETAARLKMRRVVLISSIAVVDGHVAGGRLLHSGLPALPTSLYGLTKTLQEEVALFHHRQSGISIVILRPAYVTDADTLTDKYGRTRPSANWQFVDRRDVAGAALAALRAPGIGFARYFVPGHLGAASRMDVATIRTELGWTPRHDFSAWPEDAPK